MRRSSLLSLLGIILLPEVLAHTLSAFPQLRPVTTTMPTMKRKREEGCSTAPSEPNPLRNKELLVDAAREQAAILAQRPTGQTTTAMGFCRDVLREQLGLREFAVGQWERMVISSARKEALGNHDASRIVKPPPAISFELPSLAECSEVITAATAACQNAAGSNSETSGQREPYGKGKIEESSQLRARLCAAVDPAILQQHGAMLIPAVLSGTEVASVASILARDGTCGSEVRLRASSGNGAYGAYQPIHLAAVPTLAALSQALSDVIRERLGGAPSGSKALALRYGSGGVNWAHQDQSACPYQALLLLSRPGVDFNGGRFYVADAAAVHAGRTDGVHEVEWKGSGDLVVFAANGSGSGRAWYHGMREVTAGDHRCQRLAVGLLQT